MQSLSLSTAAPFSIILVLALFLLYALHIRNWPKWRVALMAVVVGGLELILLAAGIVLVTAGALGPDTTASGNVLALFVITVAAAEVVLALAVLVAAYRARGLVPLRHLKIEGWSSLLLRRVK